MKNKNIITLLFILSLVSQISFAQDLLWEKSFGGRQAEYLTDVQPTADYGFILGGSSLSKKSGTKTQEGMGDLDYLIWKMDESGSTDWQKSFGGSGSDLLKVIKNTVDGGFVLGGISNSTAGNDKKEECIGGNDYWIIKLDAKGDEMWQKVFGGKGDDNLTSLILTSDGGYLIGGSSSSSIEDNEKIIGRKKEDSRGSSDYWIIKVNSEGKEEWQKTYGGKYADVLQSMIATADGGYLIGGYSNSTSSHDKTTANFGPGNDFWILKLDGKGKVVWQQSIGGSAEDQLVGVCQTKDGNYIVAGNSNSTTRTTKNGTDLWMVKINVDGIFLWERAFDIGKNDFLTSLIQEEDGNLLIGAYSSSGYNQPNRSEGINDYVALKISVVGEELWRKVYGSAGEDILKKIIQTRDKGYLMVGTANPEFNGYEPGKSNTKVSDMLNPFDNTQQLEGARKLQEAMDSMVTGYATKVNDIVKEKSTAIVNRVNSEINKHNDSKFKIGLNGPVGDLLNPTNTEAGKDGEKDLDKLGPKVGSKISGNKKVNYGGTDFWVVKLKNKESQLDKKVSIEAYPNSTSSYTNVIIGFDFDYGTASVYDLGGRTLQDFKIEHRTVPVNLSAYPGGIYIIQIKTNKGDGSVKIIKE